MDSKIIKTVGVMLIPVVILCVFFVRNNSTDKYQIKKLASDLSIEKKIDSIEKKIDSNERASGLAYQTALIKKAKQSGYTKISGSKTPVSSVKTWIWNYVDYNASSGDYLSYPLYFIVNSNTLIPYLKQYSPKYLHFYLCQDPNINDVNLVLVGTTDDNTGDGYLYMHIPGIPVYSDFTPSYKCGVVRYDPLIDQVKYNYPPFNPAKLPPAIGATDDITAQNWITSFQNMNYSAPAYSLLISADVLYNFITNANNQIYPPGVPPVVGPVPYIQLYLAYQTYGDPTSLTLVMAGLDNNGNHIYYTDDGATYSVLEAAEPCPNCGVQPDNQIDGPVEQLQNTINLRDLKANRSNAEGK